MGGKECAGKEDFSRKDALIARQPKSPRDGGDFDRTRR
jgi:hypothetical protein